MVCRANAVHEADDGLVVPLHGQIKGLAPVLDSTEVLLVEWAFFI